MCAAAQIVLSGSQAARMTSACWLMWARVSPVMQLWCTGVALTRSSTMLVGVRTGIHSAGQHCMPSQTAAQQWADVVVAGTQVHALLKALRNLGGLHEAGCCSLPSMRALQGDDCPSDKVVDDTC